ncbi:gas vesicle protein GvpG [Aliarcobacter butzleri]|uniref:hypothetical protein n=1 Tax=Aliarcobacter butzleri TaxID=28197 RepID=UPI0019D50AE0|nr:hypothetical protein [Aliarcobacter butzleri]
MKKNLIYGAMILSFSIALFTGCASKISDGQEKELKSYQAKGLYVEEKSVGGAAALGILPGGGSFYTRNYGLGIVNLLFWPISVLWDPVSGAWGAESINYYATKEKVDKEKKFKIQGLERELEDGKIDSAVFIKQKREVEDLYNPNL